MQPHEFKPDSAEDFLRVLGAHRHEKGPDVGEENDGVWIFTVLIVGGAQGERTDTVCEGF